MLSPHYLPTLLLFGALFSSANLLADSWTLTQNVTTSSDTMLSQQNATGSLQAVNVINLDGSTGTVASANQSMTTSGNDLTLSQDNSSSSKQAVNYISAAHITNATQTVAGVDAVVLQQTASSSNNKQALNMIIATGSGSQFGTLEQNVSVTTLAFTDAGSGNIQAGNYLEAQSGDSITQNFNASGSVTFDQSGAINSLQAGNVINKSSGTASFNSVSQSFTASSVTTTSANTTDGNATIQAANYFAQRL